MQNFTHITLVSPRFMLVFEKAAMFLDINVVRVRAAWKKTNDERKEKKKIGKNVKW
jgi:hypothetical protein